MPRQLSETIATNGRPHFQSTNEACGVNPCYALTRSEWSDICNFGGERKRVVNHALSPPLFLRLVRLRLRGSFRLFEQGQIIPAHLKSLAMTLNSIFDIWERLRLFAKRVVTEEFEKKG